MNPESAPQTRPRSEKVPAQLAAQLPPGGRDALGHPLRREILRALNESATARGADQIAATTLAGTSLSLVVYHLRVLEQAGAVAVADTHQSSGAVSSLYTSRIADDERFVSVLDATSDFDRWAGASQ